MFSWLWHQCCGDLWMTGGKESWLFNVWWCLYTVEQQKERKVFPLALRDIPPSKKKARGCSYCMNITWINFSYCIEDESECLFFMIHLICFAVLHFVRSTLWHTSAVTVCFMGFYFISRWLTWFSVLNRNRRSMSETNAVHTKRCDTEQELLTSSV